MGDYSYIGRLKDLFQKHLPGSNFMIGNWEGKDSIYLMTLFDDHFMINVEVAREGQNEAARDSSLQTQGWTVIRVPAHLLEGRDKELAKFVDKAISRWEAKQ